MTWKAQTALSLSPLMLLSLKQVVWIGVGLAVTCAWEGAHGQDGTLVGRCWVSKALVGRCCTRQSIQLLSPASFHPPLSCKNHPFSKNNQQGGGVRAGTILSQFENELKRKMNHQQHLWVVNTLQRFLHDCNILACFHHREYNIFNDHICSSINKCVLRMAWHKGRKNQVIIRMTALM